MMKNPDLVFTCRKCEHNLFVDKVHFIKSVKMPDCPNCGEESDFNWIFEREGNYEKEYGVKNDDN